MRTLWRVPPQLVESINPPETFWSVIWCDMGRGLCSRLLGSRPSPPTEKDGWSGFVPRSQRPIQQVLEHWRVESLIATTRLTRGRRLDFFNFILLTPVRQRQYGQASPMGMRFRAGSGRCRDRLKLGDRCDSEEARQTTCCAEEAGAGTCLMEREERSERTTGLGLAAAAGCRRSLSLPHRDRLWMEW